MRRSGYNAKLMAQVPAYRRKKMRKFLLYSSTFMVLNGVAEAACIQTPTCSSLGYESTTSCSGGLKCPFGNAWNCTLVNKITELEKIIEKNQQEEALANCKIGDILYSDMSCNANMVASKTPIGVVFDTTNHLAVAKDEQKFAFWGGVADIPTLTNYDSATAATGDWQGFKNTKAIYESGYPSPVVEYILSYSTEGTEAGRWYLPASGELKAISDNLSAVNTTLSKIGGTQLAGMYYSSTEKDSGSIYAQGMGGGVNSTPKSHYSSISYPARGIIKYDTQDKISRLKGQVSPCITGRIFYSDKKCYYEDVSNQTPIGIVGNSEKRLVISLQSSSKKWSEVGFDSPLRNYPVDEASDDVNGKSNTKTMQDYCKSKGYSCPAFEYASTYKTAGTNAGDWYIPASGEWSKYIGAYDGDEFLEARLKDLGYNINLTSYIPTSTEYNASQYWSSGSNSEKGYSRAIVLLLNY